jgi:hypothetical protein
MSERLNAIVEFLWPKLSVYVAESMVKELQPRLDEALPRALKGMSLDQDKCHLGQKPLEFRKVQIHKETQTTAVGDLENLVFMFRFEWNADCEIFLKIAGTGIGLRGVSIKGVLMVEAVGLMDRPPFVEGVRAFLANPPEIDLEFQGAAERFLNVGIVRQLFLNVLRDQINSSLVVPNRIGIPMVPHADIFMIKAPPSQGILTVTVWSARELPAMDVNWFSKPSSDPYVVVQCGAHRLQSPTQYKTLCPNFEYTVSLPISEPANQWMCLELFDEDTWGGDDFLGKVSLPVKEVIAQGPHRQFTLKLRDEDGHTSNNGDVCLSAEWRPFRLDCTGSQHAVNGLIFAGVYSAWNLPWTEKSTKYWVNTLCSGLLPGFDAKVTSTPHLEVNCDNHLHDNAEDLLALKDKLKILQKHHVSSEDMAKILEVDVGKLKDFTLSRSATGLADGLAGAQRQKVNWDHGFEYPVENVNNSELTFELMCQGSSGHPRRLGVYSCSTAELTAAENSTSWRTVQVPGTAILIKIKLAARYLEECLVRL